MNKEFFMVPNRVFDVGLSTTEIAVFCYLLRCADNETRLCFPSYTKICETCKISRQSAINAIKVLCDRKYVDKVSKGYSGEYGVKRANTYRINWG